MHQRIELVGGYMDGMITFVEQGQQEIILIADVPEPVKLDDDLYPVSETKKMEVKYRRRLKEPWKFDWVEE